MWVSRKKNESLCIKTELKEGDHFKYLGSMLTRDGYYTKDIKTRIAMVIEAFNTEMLFLRSKLNTELRKKLVRFYIRRIAFYGSEICIVGNWSGSTWTISKCGAGEQ